MKYRYNDLSITARLPDELLAKIFTHGVSTDMRNFSQAQTIQLAGVCTAWRRVALNCLYLWNRVRYVNSIEWLTEMAIPRSGQLPLHVFLTNEDRPKGLNVILGEIHRIEHLTCYVNDDQPRRETIQIQRNLMNPAPMLKTCTMTTRNLFELPHFLFAYHSPKLITLSLENFILPKELSFMSGLTVFECKYTGWSAGVSFLHLVALLAVAPQLVTLELRNACGEIDTMLTARAYIPHLQYLTLTDSTMKCTSFLSHIIYPPTTYLDIFTDRFDSMEREDVRKLGQELGTHIADVVSLCIDSDYRCQAHNTYKVELDYVTESQTDQAQVKVRFWESEQIQAFVATLSLQHLQVLKLRLTSINEAVLNITSNSHYLKTLVVNSFGSVSYVSLLDGISKDEMKSVHRLHKDFFMTQPGRFESSDPVYHISKMKNSLALMLKYTSPVPGPLRFPSLKSLTITDLGYQSDHDIITLAP
ncbi:hypothetical protein J132_02286 [Termitomyces sp. J132]|nr:hypothetical protein H2248_002316 [Termitomyces sp. 'cryptogamus']KNZ78095.1 hypothetical protein J132_02286 [Termitomyces sp. J132]